MKEIYRYVIQNQEGKFYWKDSSTSSCNGFDSSFDKAFFFRNEKSGII